MSRNEGGLEEPLSLLDIRGARLHVVVLTQDLIIIQEVGKAVKFTVSEGVAGYARVGEAVEREEGKTGDT